MYLCVGMCVSTGVSGLLHSRSQNQARSTDMSKGVSELGYATRQGDCQKEMLSTPHPRFHEAQPLVRISVNSPHCPYTRDLLPSGETESTEITKLVQNYLAAHRKAGPRICSSDIVVNVTIND